MNTTEMIICSVEYYSYLKNIPSNTLYKFFEKKGIIDMLLENAPVFNTMDAGFLMGVIDGYMENTYDSEENDFIHYAERQATLEKTASIIAEKSGISELDAVAKFYDSNLGAEFSDDENKLYEKDPEELAALFLAQ